MTIGERLRQLRQQNGRTLLEVKNGTGLSVSLLSDIEHNRTRPSLSSLEKLADFYKVPVSHLVGKADDSQAEELLQNLPTELKALIDELRQNGEEPDMGVIETMRFAELRADSRPDSLQRWRAWYYQLHSVMRR